MPAAPVVVPAAPVVVPSEPALEELPAAPLLPAVPAVIAGVFDGDPPPQPAAQMIKQPIDHDPNTPQRTMSRQIRRRRVAHNYGNAYEDAQSASALRRFQGLGAGVCVMTGASK
jgi:hypothetical protein